MTFVSLSPIPKHRVSAMPSISSLRRIRVPLPTYSPFLQRVTCSPSSRLPYEPPKISGQRPNSFVDTLPFFSTCSHRKRSVQRGLSPERCRAVLQGSFRSLSRCTPMTTTARLGAARLVTARFRHPPRCRRPQACFVLCTSLEKG